jgi:hypothetical protein
VRSEKGANRLKAELQTVAMPDCARAHLDTTIGTPDLSGSNTRRLHTCRMNPAFRADAASCIGGGARMCPH